MKKNRRKIFFCFCLAALFLVGCGKKEYEAKNVIEEQGNTFQIGDLQLEVKSQDKKRRRLSRKNHRDIITTTKKKRVITIMYYTER